MFPSRTQWIAFWGALFLTSGPCLVHTQEVIASNSAAIASSTQSAAIPDAPQPRMELASAQSGQTATPQQSTTADGTKSGAQQSSASSQDATQPTGEEETKQQRQQQEVKEQEQQRVLGIVPNFNLTYRHDAVSLTAAQKMSLALHSSVDPFQFAAAFMVAGYHEALNEDPGFGWGTEGYFKRSGAAYLDAFDGDMIGNGILPAVLHQDPRYFRLGQGTIKHRVLYAVMTNFVCKGDNGHWQPNVSNIGGNIIAGALSNLYYPSQNSGWGQTIGNGFIVTTEGGFGSLFDEFWPDISRKLLHKDPTHGLDAQQAAEARKSAGDGKPSRSDNGSGTESTTTNTPAPK